MTPATILLVILGILIGGVLLELPGVLFGALIGFLTGSVIELRARILKLEQQVESSEKITSEETEEAEQEPPYAQYKDGIVVDEDIKSVMVTAGYIDKEARKDIYKYIDAANVDLKAFTETFYHKLTFSHLDDVLETLIWLKNETEVWFEITTLLIPGENDSLEEIKRLTNWIVENLGSNVPLHFTAFHPTFKMRDHNHTPTETLDIARKIALEEGINYCYTGNVHDIGGQTTYCPKCKEPLIIRDWHSVLQNKIAEGKCHHCGDGIAGVF